MGQKLQHFFELIKTEGGIMAQMRLAMKTSLTSDKASSMPDTPENLERVKEAFREITGKDAPALCAVAERDGQYDPV
jgi:hypothetical protein